MYSAARIIPGELRVLRRERQRTRNVWAGAWRWCGHSLCPYRGKRTPTGWGRAAGVRFASCGCL